MNALWMSFLQTFLPLFFAVNALAMVPLFTSMTSSLNLHDQRSLLRKAIFAAFIVAIIILGAGKMIFSLMGITPDDFRVGGGLVLLLIGVLDLLSSQYEARRNTNTEDIGVVPIGIPLIIGPGALTAIMVGVDRSGYLLTLFALIINLAFAWLIFHYSYVVVRIMGAGGARAFGKVASLLLVAIAVMMIRTGIKNFII